MIHATVIVPIKHATKYIYSVDLFQKRLRCPWNGTKWHYSDGRVLVFKLKISTLVCEPWFAGQELLNRCTGACYQSVLYKKRVWNTSKKPNRNVAGTWPMEQLSSLSSYLIWGALHGTYVREHLLPHPFPCYNHSSNSVSCEQIRMWLVWTVTCWAVIFNLFLCWT